MKLPLYDYQKKACSSIFNDLKTEPNVLLSAIMGSGKTAMAVSIVEAVMDMQEGINVLILAHKEKLLTQFHEAFGKFTDIPSHKIGISCAGLKTKVINTQITIASVQTFIKQKEKYESAGLLVIDEAHRTSVGTESQYDKIINYLRLQRPNMRILGITATTFRLGTGRIYGTEHTEGSSVLFPRCNYTIKYKELLDAGHSVPLKGKVAVADSYKADIKQVKTQNNDYMLDQLSEMMTRPVYITEAVKAIKEHCQNYKCLCVFCCTIDHAEILNDAIGKESTIIHSKLTPLEKYQNMQDWESGKKRIIVSVNMLSEGVDFPKLDCLVMDRPTQSAGLYLQAIGRLLRPCEGKTHGFLLDLTENTNTFGTDLDKIKIKIPKSVLLKKKKEYEKLCPECDAIVHKALTICDACGYEWPITVLQNMNHTPDMINVNFEPEKPILCHVHNLNFYIHESRRTKKNLIKCVVGYETEESSTPFFANIWFCLPDFYDGYAVKKSNEKWLMLSNGELGDMPADCEQFLETAYDIACPEKVLIQPAKYPEIMDIEHGKCVVIPF